MIFFCSNVVLSSVRPGKARIRVRYKMAKSDGWKVTHLITCIHFCITKKKKKKKKKMFSSNGKDWFIFFILECVYRSYLIYIWIRFSSDSNSRLLCRHSSGLNPYSSRGMTFYHVYFYVSSNIIQISFAEPHLDQAEAHLGRFTQSKSLWWNFEFDFD